MGKEYDIINELGPKNWLDVVAGEAVILGHFFNDPYLVVKGTKLAGMIRETHFDDDNYCEVEAMAHSLGDELTARKNKEQASIFLDELYMGDQKEKSMYDWEFSFILVGGRYQIQMIMPMYFEKIKLANPVKIEAEKRVQAVYDDPSFESYRKEIVSTVCQEQTFVNTKFFDAEGRIVRRIVDFNHHEIPAWGWNDFYFFDDFGKALEAWQGVREAFTSGQKQ